MHITKDREPSITDFIFFDTGEDKEDREPCITDPPALTIVIQVLKKKMQRAEYYIDVYIHIYKYI